ncbi:MAG: nucleoside triphosphate pyrophosphohydrolase family protein [Chloroflexi bacterium]|nr:nucleoside triphosphate pyrophosphohydrolase family protein [Chloroflexota bacterium]
MPLTFSEYQRRTADTAIYPDVGRNPIYPTLGLAGEAGEVCEKVKKVLRDSDGQFSAEAVGAIQKELGDVLWYAARLAAELGLDLGQVAEANLSKLASRQQRDHLSGSGDDR